MLFHAVLLIDFFASVRYKKHLAVVKRTERFNKGHFVVGQLGLSKDVRRKCNDDNPNAHH